MTDETSNKIKSIATDTSLIGGAGLLASDGLGDFSEPIGLVLAVLGAVIKLVTYFKKNGLRN